MPSITSSSEPALPRGPLPQPQSAAIAKARHPALRGHNRSEGGGAKRADGTRRARRCGSCGAGRARSPPVARQQGDAGERRGGLRAGGASAGPARPPRRMHHGAAYACARGCTAYACARCRRGREGTRGGHRCRGTRARPYSRRKEPRSIPAAPWWAPPPEAAEIREAQHTEGRPRQRG